MQFYMYLCILYLWQQSSQLVIYTSITWLVCCYPHQFHWRSFCCTVHHHQVFASESQGPGRGEQRLPVSLPAAGQLSKGRGSRQIQVLHPQRQGRGDQSHG